MTLHPPKRPARPPRREPMPLTLGHVLGEQVRADRGEKAAAEATRKRRAELDDQGFTPIKGAP